MLIKTKTRLAPSPTGMFHIGSARTALFNYLFAKKNGGKFILRFEDTDKLRSKKEYERDILKGLKWLGLNFDERIYYQTEDLKKYQKYVDKLLKENKAYKKDNAIWFRLDLYPKDLIKYKDLIMGEIEFKKEAFNDFVIIKSNGIPSFMFGNTIDDHENKITHVIRGTEHINSTPQQIMIYESLNLPVPQFAHIPLILNSDRSKMSKRKDPVSITRDFRDKGYLPEAMINYMTLLGWNPKDNREFFTLDELVKKFDLKNVNKSGAVFDITKLNYFNNHYIRKLDDNELAKLIVKSGKLKVESKSSKLEIDNFLLRIILVIKERMQKLTDFDKLSNFFFDLPDYQSSLLIFKKSTRELTLKGLYNSLFIIRDSKKEDWTTPEKLNKLLSKVVSDNNLKNGDVFWPVRLALSGLEKSPSPPELLWVLEKDESLKRINSAIKKLTKTS